MADGKSTPVIHVVAGVLRDDAGRILLAGRPEGRDLAGRWEFPGGKREPGESPEQALRRELREELGIEIGAVSPLIAVPHAAPGKRIELDVYEVAGFTGEPQGLEQQPLRWVPPHTLCDYPMPPADRPVVAALQAPSHYLITPTPGPSDADFLARCQRALDGGIRRLQLRAPGIERARVESLARALVSRCAAIGADLLINGDIALARALGIGVHLRAGQLEALDVRPLPKSSPVAASCHDLEELRRACALAVDFAVLGPVQATASHPEARPIGWAGFAALREHVDLPLYALGGLGPLDLPMARRHGAQGIAGIRAYWPDAD